MVFASLGIGLVILLLLFIRSYQEAKQFDLYEDMHRQYAVMNPSPEFESSDPAPERSPVFAEQPAETASVRWLYRWDREPIAARSWECPSPPAYISTILVGKFVANSMN